MGKSIRKRIIDAAHNEDRQFKEFDKFLDLVDVEEKKFKEGANLDKLKNIKVYEIIDNFENIEEGYRELITIKRKVEGIEPVVTDVDFI